MALADLKLPPITFKRAAHYSKGRTEPIRAFVNHRMVGTLAGTDAYFTNPETRPVSTHFGIGYNGSRVVISQYVPIDDTAFGNGNYDPSGSWDDWGFKVTEVNPQTINIEHQDHDGTDANKGVVKEAVQQASMALQALLRYGTLAQWKAAGIVVRDWANNGPILQRELRAIPIDGRHVITHNDIAGRLKPYCWKPWAKDTVGFPRSKYVNGILAYKSKLAYVAPPPAPPPPTTPVTYTQAQLDAAVATAVTPLKAEVARLIQALATANSQLAAEKAEDATVAATLRQQADVLTK